MKKLQRVKKRRKIGRLRASGEIKNTPLEPLPEWRGYFKPIKRPVTLRLDADVLAWFKKQGQGYQTRINRALRKVMLDERKKSRV
jgi:uncharacterized protein (DUF4415 family)